MLQTIRPEQGEATRDLNGFDLPRLHHARQVLGRHLPGSVIRFLRFFLCSCPAHCTASLPAPPLHSLAPLLPCRLLVFL
eukprot:272591-Hanusia_phi.AAC.2